MLVILLVALVAALVVYWAFFMREHSSWDETVLFRDGTFVLAHREHSQKAYHGHPHLFGWGGGDDRDLLTFTFRGQNHTWRGPHTPIVLDQKDGIPYLAVFDRETDFSNIRFRLYAATGPETWVDVKPGDFPKSGVIQNMWLDTDDRKALRTMAPSDYWFRTSLTAKLWSYLANPDKFNHRDEPDESFVREYKDRWIKRAKTEAHP